MDQTPPPWFGAQLLKMATFQGFFLYSFSFSVMLRLVTIRLLRCFLNICGCSSQAGFRLSEMQTWFVHSSFIYLLQVFSPEWWCGGHSLQFKWSPPAEQDEELFKILLSRVARQVCCRGSSFISISHYCSLMLFPCNSYLKLVVCFCSVLAGLRQVDSWDFLALCQVHE